MYPATEISHLPGIGRYSLDSYRIFCERKGKPDDWKEIIPLDKELRVYIVSRFVFL
jgi:methyl-CpG-binding domain protein 4